MPESTFGNVHEYTVSELANALKRSIEEDFAFVRVRGELGRVVRAASGHFYLDLKDDKAVINSLIWKTTAERLRFAPEQGMEVVATGRMTTFPGKSQYQLVIDSLEPAGVGALMALFEERKKKLAAEGLFAAERKKKLPFLPEVIGVVTSPSGAVIRDILHRLRERFPRHVLVWPAPVQGKGAELKIAAAIDGFNALLPGGPVPRPDVLIVARGGGSLEDLWCFNEEVVARAAAASKIPLISAVGHETDTTLIDFVADRRAPTPTAAAEMAVPVRTELLAEVLNKERRFIRACARAAEARKTALIAAMRGLGRPEDIIGVRAQRLDHLTELLISRMRSRLEQAGTRLARIAGDRFRAAAQRGADRKARALAALRMSSATLMRSSADGRKALDRAAGRFGFLSLRLLERPSQRLGQASGLLKTLSHQSILERGFALVRAGDGRVIRRAADAASGAEVALVFADGEKPARIGGAPVVKPKGRRSPATSPARPRQKSLFD